LAGIAEKVDDQACDMACEGDEEFACGGNLKLSVYKREANSASGLRAVAGLALASLVVLHAI
jgi:hypothetical protein